MKQQCEQYKTTTWTLWNNNVNNIKQQREHYETTMWTIWNNNVNTMKQQCEQYKTTVATTKHFVQLATTTYAISDMIILRNTDIISFQELCDRAGLLNVYNCIDTYR